MKKILSIFLLGIILTGITEAQEVKSKALFLYNFTKYVGWPPETKEGDFVIGVLGSNAIYEKLSEMTNGKMAGNQQIVVQKFNSCTEISGCHMIFVSHGNAGAKDMEAIRLKLGNTSTLIVTEEEGAAKRGAMINFVVRDQIMKFELNKENAEKCRLQVSQNLEKMAIPVS